MIEEQGEQERRGGAAGRKGSRHSHLCYVASLLGKAANFAGFTYKGGGCAKLIFMKILK